MMKTNSLTPAGVKKSYLVKGVCFVCKTPFESKPGKRARLTCGDKCRRIKSYDNRANENRRKSLVSLRSRLWVRLQQINKELEELDK